VCNFKSPIGCGGQQFRCLNEKKDSSKDQKRFLQAEISVIYFITLNKYSICFTAQVRSVCFTASVCFNIFTYQQTRPDLHYRPTFHIFMKRPHALAMNRRNNECVISDPQLVAVGNNSAVWIRKKIHQRVKRDFLQA